MEVLEARPDRLALVPREMIELPRDVRPGPSDRRLVVGVHSAVQGRVQRRRRGFQPAHESLPIPGTIRVFREVSHRRADREVVDHAT